MLTFLLQEINSFDKGLIKLSAAHVDLSPADAMDAWKTLTLVLTTIFMVNSRRKLKFLNQLLLSQCLNEFDS